MIRITLVFSPAPREVFEEALSLPPGACVRDAVRASGLGRRFPALDCEADPAWVPGIWGQAVAWEQPLQEQDRIELCRPLKADPKAARRERFARQGARGTGLFAKRRAGAKAGY